jgi:hypothetical protein
MSRRTKAGGFKDSRLWIPDTPRPSVLNTSSFLDKCFVILSAALRCTSFTSEAAVCGPEGVAIFDALHDQLGELLFAGFAKMCSAPHQKVS